MTPTGPLARRIAARSGRTGAPEPTGSAAQSYGRDMAVPAGAPVRPVWLARLQAKDLTAA